MYLYLCVYIVLCIKSPCDLKSRTRFGLTLSGINVHIKFLHLIIYVYLVFEIRSTHSLYYENLMKDQRYPWKNKILWLVIQIVSVNYNKDLVHCTKELTHFTVKIRISTSLGLMNSNDEIYRINLDLQLCLLREVGKSSVSFRVSPR